MSGIYARIINHYELNYHTLFSASFYKIIEEDQRNNEIELFINLKINHKLTEYNFDIIEVRSQLEHQLQTQETEESVWKFDKLNSMKLSFCKTGELNGSSYVKTPLRRNARLIIQNLDKYCFIWFRLSYLHPCNNSHPKRVKNYLQYFSELNIDGFDFRNGFKCSDVQKLEKLNNLSINIFELNFYQDQNNWKNNLIPIEINKNESDGVADILVYKNHYALIKKMYL